GAVLTSVTGAPGALGSFVATIADASTGDGTGAIGWTFTVNDGAIDYLAAGETITQVYTVTVTDSSGATTSQTVTVTINGTNDAPVITSGPGTGSVNEIADGALGETTAPLTATGALTFGDVDLSNTHTVGAVLTSVTGAPGALGSFVATIADAATGDGTGAIGWTFTVNDGAIDYLAAGETITQVYTVTVTDSSGATSSQTVTVTINGTNDAPVITSGPGTGSVSEIADGALGETTAPLTATGALTFGDVDLSNTHTVGAVLTSVTGAPGALGSFVATIADASTGDGTGAIGWTFTVIDGAIDYLAAGETITQVYTVTVTDSSGATSSQTVTVTINGTNDAPVITSGPGTGSVSEIADGALGEATAPLTATGALTFGDVDLSNTHTVGAVLTSVTGAPGALGSFVATIADASTGDGTGAIGWTFTVNDGAIDYLAAGETITQVYTVTVTDSSGATDTQTVTVTINGTNDAPVITSGPGTGSVSEIADGALGETTAPLTATGALTFGDVDLSNTHTVGAVLTSVTGAPGALGSFVATIADASTGDGTGAIG
ncbi:VCBS domain-containing protein, partial [Pararhizobium sp. YC-54]|uniref:beta strand repeat-containing protein n=1 Tax=Pararhizobium sp. YC-54 TaxID=2986920 RepID=UPI0021F7FD2B